MTKDDDNIIVTRTLTNNTGIVIDMGVKKHRRRYAEEHGEATRHPIVALMLYDKEGRILVIEKTNKSGENRLHNTLSLFFGEHILYDTHEYKKNLNLSFLARHVINDLVKEELKGADIKIKDDYPRFMLLENSDVGMSHIGYVFEGSIESTERLMLDGTEDVKGLMTLGEIMKHYGRLNGWSKLIVDALLETTSK